MNEPKINIPDGYEVDKENSTFELTKFKKKEKQLPKTWEEYTKSNEWKIPFVSSQVGFRSEEQCEAVEALAQLSQLREVYRDGWKPDYSSPASEQYCIIIEDLDNLRILKYYYLNFFLSFQSHEIAQQFLDNFRDLILKAKPLMS